ncbi:MAG: DUF2905 family protein [Candidatus Dadabacteria bacterium]|nr:DUF2905 family protein [Candidatus Dadabacteria bacterium]NIQ15597.1 DUF2905 family protein [Candidatus Dadabacteria bacterium]
MSEIRKIIILLGILIILIGIFLPYLSKLNIFGRLPGDISIKGNNYSIYLPITSFIIISLLLTLILNLIFRK